MAKHSLDSVTIDGFRGLKSLRLDGLGLINVVVGPNDSGKTSVLEALSILCNPLEPSEWMRMVRRRDFGRLDETRIQSLRWCFTQSGRLADPEAIFEAACTMTCAGTLGLRKLRATYKEIVREPDQSQAGRRDEGQVQGDGEDEEDVVDIQQSRGAEIVHFIDWDPCLPGAPIDDLPIMLQVWEDQPVPPGRPPLTRSPVPTETLTPYSYQINRVQVRYQSKTLFEPRRDLVLDLVREFDPDVRDIDIASFRGARPAIYLNHRRLGPAPLSVFGDAMRRAVLLASTLPSLQGGGVLLIDEIETGIHVSALERVFTWLTKAAQELRVQIVATTHSLEAVDAMASSSRDGLHDLVTFHLDQTEHETRTKRIDEDLLVRLRRERTLDVR